MRQEPPTGHVYVDARLAPGSDPPELDPTLAHLCDEGYRVVLVGAATRATGTGQRRPAQPVANDAAHLVVIELPTDAEGWLVTADAGVCAGARDVRRLRTILVGPTMQGRGLAHRASDAEARDLLDAVLMILTAGAMPGDARAR